jgi:hypothetical protein
MNITEKESQEYNALPDSEKREYKDASVYVAFKRKKEALKKGSCPLNITGEIGRVENCDSCGS